MKGVPQSDLQNPALHNDSSQIVVGFPGLSGMYFNASSGFVLNDLIHKGTGSQSDSLVYDIYSFHNSLESRNSIQQNIGLPLLYLSIWRNKSVFSFGITEKQFAQLDFDKRLVTFIRDGNGPYLGQHLDLGNIDFHAMHYREFAFGCSNELINNKLTVGVKLKALFGKSAIQTQRMNLQVETAADGSYLNLRSDMEMNLSMQATLEYDSLNYLSGMRTDILKPAEIGNFGMAFDLGAVYKLSPKILISFSLVDIGKISFKKDLISMKKTVNYQWEGIDVSKSIDPEKPDYVSLSDLFKEETDKMKDSFRPNKSEIGNERFGVNIPMRIYFGGTYQINDKINIGLLDQLYRYKSTSRNMVTLSGNAALNNFFSLTGSYSLAGNSYKNFGLGMAMRWRFAQLYMVSDNLLAVNPAKAKLVNFRFGMNFFFGQKHASEALGK